MNNHLPRMKEDTMNRDVVVEKVLAQYTRLLNGTTPFS